MGRNAKSSATPGTRKKHATKKADETQPQNKQQASNKKKYSKKHGIGQAKPPPPPKRFIPPPKPPRPAPDPLEAWGLASVLPAELVVILKKFSKKDATTKVRAVEDFNQWVLDVDSREGGRQSLIVALPVWFHHLPYMLLGSNRRLRQVSLSVNIALLSSDLDDIRSNFLYTISESDYEAALGAWLLANPQSWLNNVIFEGDSEDRVQLLEEYQVEPVVNYISTAIRSPQLLLPGSASSETKKDILAEQEESTKSKEARIKSAGLNALGQLIMTIPLSFDVHDLVRDLLDSGAITDCFRADEGEEVVRRAAWSLLLPLLKRDNGKLVEDNLNAFALAILNSAFTEGESTVRSVLFDGLLTFLHRFPSSWEIAIEEESNEENEDEIPKSVSNLLTYLELGCRSSPPQIAYSSMLVIIMTMPKQYLGRSCLSRLLVSFLAPLYSNIFPSPPSLQARHADALLKAFCECLVAIVVNVVESEDEKISVAVEWFKGIWEAFVTSPTRDANLIATDGVAELLFNTLVKLKKSTGDIVNQIVDQVEEDTLSSSNARRSTEVLSFMANAAEGQDKTKLASLIEKTISDALNDSVIDVTQTALKNVNSISTIQSILPQLDDFIMVNLPTLVSGEKSSQAIDLLLAYIAKREDKELVKQAWKGVLSAEPSLEAVSKLLDADERQQLSDKDLEGAGSIGGIDEMVLLLANRDIEGEADAVEKRVINGVMQSTEKFISSVMAQSLESLYIDAFRGSVEAKLYRGVEKRLVSVSSIEYASMSVLSQLAREIFMEAYIVNDDFIAKKLWEELKTSTEITVSVREFAVSLISNVELLIDPKTILGAYYSKLAEFEEGDSSIANRLINALNDQHDMQLSKPLPSSLAVIDEMVPHTSDFEDLEVDWGTYDNRGFSSYIRNVEGLLNCFSRDTSIAVNDANALIIIFGALRVVDDELSVSGCTSAFSKDVEKSSLHKLSESLKTSSTYTLYKLGSAIDQTALIKAVRSGSDAKDALTVALRTLYHDGRIGSLRVFRDILQSVLRRVENVENDRWIGMAGDEYTKDNGEYRTRALLLSVKSHAISSPRLARLQNEIASQLTGITAADASEKGLPLLRILISSAPPLDAEEGLLPQQRALFLLKCVRDWVMSDEDLDEELDGRLAELFIHLVPIVQEIDGSHWDLVFDLVEANIEIASLDEGVLLYNSLRLFDQLMFISKTNSTLTHIWKDRRSVAFEHLRTLFLSLGEDASTVSTRPRNVCEDLVLKLVQALPKDLISDESFDPMINMLNSYSIEVRKVAHRLLYRLVKAQVEKAVIESAVDNGEEGRLPNIITDKIGEKITYSIDDIRNDEVARRHAFALLLLWDITFQHFHHASDALRSKYNEQFRQSGVIGNTFLPLIFTIMGLFDKNKAVDLSAYQIDEFYVQYYEDDEYIPTAVFAAFIYYKSLKYSSGHVRAWWTSNQNRQLSMIVNGATAKYFSPQIIQDELKQLRNPSSLKELQNEAFSIKVAQNSSEVTATYIVDEQSMEIGIKLPQLFPLEPVEIRNIRRVGVNERQWRAWLLAVQQVIGTQSGPLLEALSLFKRNVSLHFDGVTECAICYSIVQTSDRTLPSKKCKVCSNKFHGACLYTWFQSSTSSTCPLCRQIW